MCRRADRGSFTVQKFYKWAEKGWTYKDDPVVELQNGFNKIKPLT